MRQCDLSPEEAMETVESYVERVRRLSLSDLTNYIIENKLSQVQRQVIRDYWFSGIPPAQTAERLHLSLSAVYAARSKAQRIIREYLEPLMMYFQDLPRREELPPVETYLAILRAKKQKAAKANETLKNIRISHAVTLQALAGALGISEAALQKIEQGRQDITLHLLQKYNEIFHISISLEYGVENGGITWKEQ